MRSLSVADVIQALQEFQLNYGRLPSNFYTDFDKRMVLGDNHRCLLYNISKIFATPVGLQSHNGIVELTCRSLLYMSHSYLTYEQIPRECWYYSISYNY